MKKFTLLTIALISSLLFVQCKKSEVLTEEIISTEKAMTPNQLDGTTWEVLSVTSGPSNVNINWTIKHPKFSFNDGNVEMQLGRDNCSKEYLLKNTKFVVAYSYSCSITNSNHITLANLFAGEFWLIQSNTDPNILLVKSIDDTMITLRRVNTLSPTINVVTSVQ